MTIRNTTIGEFGYSLILGRSRLHVVVQPREQVGRSPLDLWKRILDFSAAPNSTLQVHR